MSQFPKLTLSSRTICLKILSLRCLLQLLHRGGLSVPFFPGLLSFARVWLALSLFSLSNSISLFLRPRGPGQVPPSPRCLVAVDCPGW